MALEETSFGLTLGTRSLGVGIWIFGFLAFAFLRKQELAFETIEFGFVRMLSCSIDQRQRFGHCTQPFFGFPHLYIRICQ